MDSQEKDRLSAALSAIRQAERMVADGIEHDGAPYALAADDVLIDARICLAAAAELYRARPARVLW